jgi:opacity protein-like surface antigen
MVACALAAGPAQAQPAESGGTANLILSATTIEEGAALAITGAIGYRFNRIVGVSLELTGVPSFDPELPEVAAPTPLPLGIGGNGPVSVGNIGGIVFPVPAHEFSDEEGEATIFTANLRLDIPTRWRRLQPYVVSGAGVAHVRDEFTVTTGFPRFILPGLPGTTIYDIPSISREVAQSSTDMAVTIGGGIGLRVAQQLVLEGDVRYLAVLGARDLQIGRFGVGISYRF